MPKSNDERESWRDRRVRSNGTVPTASGDGVVDLDVSWLVPADLSAVEALARLQVAATRCGRWLQLRGADGDLVELLEAQRRPAPVRVLPSVRAARRTALAR